MTGVFQPITGCRIAVFNNVESNQAITLVLLWIEIGRVVVLVWARLHARFWTKKKVCIRKSIKKFAYESSVHQAGPPVSVA